MIYLVIILQFKVVIFFTMELSCVFITCKKEKIFEYLSRGSDEDYGGIFSIDFLHVFPFFLMWNNKNWRKFPVTRILLCKNIVSNVHSRQ